MLLPFESKTEAYFIRTISLPQIRPKKKYYKKTIWQRTTNLVITKLKR